MAELLGIIAGTAGLASLAIQLGEISVKIKRFYKSYKEAPQLLQDIAEDLETFALALHSLERDRQQHSCADMAILNRCTQTCVKAVAQIDAAVNKFELTVQKSNFKGRVQTALGHTNLTRFCDDLERAKSSLIFAYQLYTRLCQKNDTSRILERLSDNTTLLQQVEMQVAGNQLMDRGSIDLSIVRQFRPPEHKRKKAAFLIVQQKHTKPHQRQSSDKTWRIRFNPWYAAQIWEISFSTAQSGFNFSVRSCNVVPRDSLIFDACRGGDVREVRDLFQSGEASPFDYCETYQNDYGEIEEEGMTVLAAAASSRNLQLCQYLIDIAGFPVSPEKSADPLNTYVVATRRMFTVEDNAVDMYRLLLKQPQWDFDDLITDKRSCPWWTYCPDSSCVRLVREEFAMAFGELSWESQVKIAIDNCGWRSSSLPQIFLAMLGHPVVDAHLAQTSDESGRTALHMLGTQMGLAGIWNVPENWVQFTRQLLDHGADIHKSNDVGDTPFMCLLKQLSRNAWPGAWDAIKSWARMLEEAEIDLVAYGNRELSIWNELYPTGIEGYIAKITSWNFAACADEWSLDGLLSCEIPVYRMVAPPGAWPMRDEFEINTICWRPQPNDILEASWQEMERQRDTLYVKPHHFREQYQLNDVDYHLSCEFEGMQDDFGVVMRLIRSNYKVRRRPRSCSQPRTVRSRRIYTERHWLPQPHICQWDGYLKLPDNEWGGPYSRTCGTAIILPHGSDQYDYREKIKQQIRLFQTRYHNTDELRSLPYAAYHRRWKRDCPTSSPKDS